MTLDKCRFYSQKYPENTLIALDDAKVVGFVSYGDFRDSATIAGEIFALYVLKIIMEGVWDGSSYKLLLLPWMVIKRLYYGF